MTPFTLDHVGFGVRDLEAAAERFTRLGFKLTPRGHHVLPPLTPGGPFRSAGTSNHCAMLASGYLELIGVTDPGYAGSMLKHIERYEGLHIVAFGSSDWETAQRVLRQGPIPGAAVRPLQRPIDGDLAQFQIIDFPPEQVPEGVFFAIHHDTPKLLWKPEFLEHPNGATGLEGITIAVTDPAEFASRLRRLLDVASPGGSIDLARGKVRIVDAAWLATHVSSDTRALPFIAGITVRVRDAGRAAALLGANGLGFQERDQALWVPPGEACGGFIEFVW